MNIPNVRGGIFWIFLPYLMTTVLLSPSPVFTLNFKKPWLMKILPFLKLEISSFMMQSCQRVYFESLIVPIMDFRKKIETISHTICLIGTRQLSDMMLFTIVIDKFKSIPKYMINMESFWQHFIACGLIARELASKK